MKVRPSDLVGLDPSDPIAVYCFDRAVNAFGEALLHEIKSIEGKTKQEHKVKLKRLLAKWLPAAKAGRTVNRNSAKRSE